MNNVSKMSDWFELVILYNIIFIYSLVPMKKDSKTPSLVI